MSTKNAGDRRLGRLSGLIDDGQSLRPTGWIKAELPQGYRAPIHQTAQWPLATCGFERHPLTLPDQQRRAR